MVGLHTHWLAGIATTQALGGGGGSAKRTASSQFATAVCFSGGYEDDMDASDRCPYTGAGGNDLLHNRRQIADQSILENTSNKSLAASCDLGIPVRVIRGSPDPESYCKKSYTYDGLYRVSSYWLLVGRSGYHVVQFMLERLQGQPAVTSATVHFGMHTNSRSLPASQRAEDRPGFVCADLSLGQEAVPICVVNTFDKKKSAHWAPAPVPIKLTAEDQTIEGVTCALETMGNKKEAFVYIARNLWSPNVPKPAPHTTPVTQKDLRKLNDLGCGAPALPYNRGFLINPGCTVFEGLRGDCPGQDISQQGMTHRLEVFLTEGKGWGVRSWDNISAYQYDLPSSCSCCG